MLNRMLDFGIECSQIDQDPEAVAIIERTDFNAARRC